MQFKLLALSAFAASVSAQSSTTGTGINTASVYAVLATALPSSLIAEALTNSGAVASQIASEFSEGSTPAWFTALPTGIQSYLLGPAASAVSGGNATGLLNSTAIANSSSTTVVRTTTHGQGHTTLVTGHGRTTATTGGSNTQTGAAASSSGAASSSSSGGASMPTNIIGAGLAGAVGLVGLLAL